MVELDNVLDDNLTIVLNKSEEVDDDDDDDNVGDDDGTEVVVGENNVDEDGEMVLEEIETGVLLFIIGL